MSDERCTLSGEKFLFSTRAESFTCMDHKRYGIILRVSSTVGTTSGFLPAKLPGELASKCNGEQEPRAVYRPLQEQNAVKVLVCEGALGVFIGNVLSCFADHLHGFDSTQLNIITLFVLTMCDDERDVKACHFHAYTICISVLRFQI